MKIENKITWFFRKIDFVGRKPPTGKDFIDSLKNVKWYTPLFIFLLCGYIIYDIYTTNRPENTDMLIVAIGLLIIAFTSAFLKLFSKKKYRDSSLRSE